MPGPRRRRQQCSGANYVRVCGTRGNAAASGPGCSSGESRVSTSRPREPSGPHIQVAVSSTTLRGKKVGQMRPRASAGSPRLGVCTGSCISFPSCALRFSVFLRDPGPGLKCSGQGGYPWKSRTPWAPGSFCRWRPRPSRPAHPPSCPASRLALLCPLSSPAHLSRSS